MQNPPFHPSLVGNEPRRSLMGKRGYDSDTGSEDDDDDGDGEAAPPAKRPNTAAGPEETEAPVDGTAAAASVATNWDVFTIITVFHDYVLFARGWGMALTTTHESEERAENLEHNVSKYASILLNCISAIRKAFSRHTPRLIYEEKSCH